MALQTAIGRVRGLGSARDGTNHWKLQRLTALGNLMLVLWFVFSTASLSGSDYVTVRLWLSSPLSAILMVLFIMSTFTHARVGLQVVIEDYVHNEPLKVASLAILQLAAFGLGVAAIVAVLLIATGT